jgi:tyrosine aminotransferase
MTSFFTFYHLRTGAVYSADHLRKIIDICEKHHIPIIADEIYADMVNKKYKNI